MAATTVNRAVPRLWPLAQRLLTPAILLPLAFVGSAAWLAWQGSHVTSFIWMIDEGLYAKAAQSYADLQGLLPHVHGHQHGVPNVLYPLLIAPFYALFSAPDAFEAAHILNGVAWASTLFPVYLLVRRLDVAWPWALLAGVLSVWVPWAVAVTVLMTEAVSYPAFAWAVYAMTVAVANPRPRNDALALLAIVVAVAARTQFVFLLPVFLVSIVVHALAVREPGRAWWRSLRDHWAVAALLVPGALAVFVATLIEPEFLGGYGVVTGLPPFPGGLWNGIAVHLGHLVVGVGILPAILYGAWLLGLSEERPIARGRLAFAVVGTVTFVVLAYQAGFFMQNVGAVLQERYISYGAPILFAGMAAFAGHHHRIAPRLTVLIATVVTAGLVAGPPHSGAEAANAFDNVANGSATHIARTGPWLTDVTAWVPGRDLSYVEAFVLITCVVGLVVTVVLASRFRRYVLPALCLLVLAWTVDATRFVVPRAVLGIDVNFPYALEGVRETPVDWADRATPDDSLVGLQVGTLGVRDEHHQWLWTTFWNESIQRSYSFDGAMRHSNWPGDRWTMDERTGELSTAEPPDYLVASQIDPALRVQGPIVAHSAYNAVVIDPAEPLRARWALDPDPQDEDYTVRFYVYPERPGAPPPSLALTIGLDPVAPEEGKVSVPYVLRDGERTWRGRLDAGEQRKITVRPRPDADGRGVVTIRQRAHPLNVAEGDAVVRIVRVDEAA